MTSKSRASSCCPSAGSSNGRSVGSTEQDASPKTSRPPSTPRSHGSSSPSPSCSRDASPGSQVKKRDFRVGLLAAVIAYEDRVALNVLRMRADVETARTGCVGLSGGGLRAALLHATSDELAACVIVGMMSTYEGLLSDCIAPHTWMLFPAGRSGVGDWPDLAASAAPSPLLVQFLLDDDLFTVEGMRNADLRLAATYARANAPEAYTGEFYPRPHRFDVPMQEA